MTSRRKSGKFEDPIPPSPLRDDYESIKEAAKFAYEWGWPLMNVDNRAKRMKQVLGLCNEKRLRIEGWPVGYNSFTLQTNRSSPNERLMCCPNSSLLYGGGAFTLGKKGAIAQVPEGLVN